MVPALHTALEANPELHVRQVRELAELFGFETRNKYAITTPQGQEVAFAAEQQKGFFGFIARQFLGHWRRFDIVFYGPDRQPALQVSHPFRWFFQRLEVSQSDGTRIGALQQRWAFFAKRFDVEDARGRVLLEMRSGFFRIWTFPFFRQGIEQAVIEKKWAGVLSEMFTDKDNFRVRFMKSTLTPEERVLILAAAVFVDLQYFERKAD
jgi:uncharacterized protein YxjI